MKRSYLTILAVFTGVCLMMLSSCRFGCVHGSGHQATENRKVADFTKLDVSGAFKIILKQDSSLALTVSADDNLLKYIKTEVSGNKLRISNGEKNICSTGDEVITIGVHNINTIKASGAVNITANDKVVTKNLHFNLSGATKINMNLDAADVNTEGSGETDITLKGQATSHNVDLSGGGKINAFDFVVGNYNISTSGATECDINVLHELNVSSSGASAIKYKGNPTSIHNDKSGISSLTKVN